MESDSDGLKMTAVGVSTAMSLRSADVEQAGFNLTTILPGLAGIVFASCVALGAEALAQPISRNADSLARSAVFGPELLAGNSEEVFERLLELRPDRRVDALWAWVMPGSSHADLRVTGHFIDAEADRGERKGVRLPGRRGPLAAPALALVDCAQEAGRLDELEMELRSLESKLVEHREKRACAALRLVVDIAQHDEREAPERFAALFDLFSKSPPPATDDRWPELLAIECALEFASLRQAVRDLQGAILELLVVDVGGWFTKATPEWIAHFLRQLSRSEHVPRSEQADALDSGRDWKLSNWSPVTLEKARTTGIPLPDPEWRFDPGTLPQVRRTVAHEDDLLFYAIPLQGDFEVECDLKPYVWQGMQLLIAGRSMSPDGHRFGLDVRGVRSSDLQHVGLPKQLSVSDEWAHVRATVRDGECRLYFDGRLIETRPVDLTGAPWIALRDPVPHRGAVRDLRISGSPLVPREVRLVADQKLAGWFSWFEEDDPSWRQSPLWPHEPGIERSQEKRLAGTFRESLLQYYRPMLEDGSIEYEFFYQPGAFEVHPAVGRTAFLLAPDGLSQHRVTSGRYERSELTPDNRTRSVDAVRATKPLPLKTGDWNHARLTLSGDVLQVSINGDLAYEGAVGPLESRTFGLFHFADQSGVRVRDVVWRGDWAQSVPDAANQELADKRASMLDRSQRHLTAVFDHDFAKSGLPGELFAVHGSDQQATLVERPDGLLVTRPVREKGYVDTWLAPRMRVSGDFDIEVTFQELSCRSLQTGWQGINLEVVPEDEGLTHCRFFRGTFFESGKVTTDMRQVQIHRNRNGQYRGHLFGTVPDESASGRLRIARRGDRIYFLLAQQNSPQFQVLHEEVVSDADLVMEGIRLRLNTVSETEGDAEHAVLWKHLSVRAESITELPVLNPEKVIAELDQHRQQLSDRVGGEIDGKTNWRERMSVAGTVSSAGDDGLQITGVGSDQWTSSRVGFSAGVSGDFDVSVTFKPTVFDNPAAGQQSAIYLRGEIPAAENTSADVILVRYPDGRQIALAEFVTITSHGLKFRDFGTENVKSVERLRLVRRGTQMTFLFSETASSEFRILGQTQVPPGDIRPGAFRFEVQTGGNGKRTVVNLKEFTLRAGKLMDSSRNVESPKSGGT